MGYRVKLAELQQARQLRRTGLPLAEIAARLGVSKSSVSLWARDVEFANSDPRMITFYCAWLRRFFEIDEKRLRAVPDPSIRHTKHVHGCVSIDYSCSATHRSIMGLVRALLGGAVIPG